MARRAFGSTPKALSGRDKFQIARFKSYKPYYPDNRTAADAATSRICERERPFQASVDTWIGLVQLYIQRAFGAPPVRGKGAGSHPSLFLQFSDLSFRP
jgi:hypothetical protein